MELVESIFNINEELVREFGLEFNGWPKFRVVFSEDQYEQRLTSFTDEGFELLHPEVREFPKYSHIHDKYILERLIPVVGNPELVTNISYEPCWTFEDRRGNYLPPAFEACKMIIETLYSQIEKKGQFKKFVDPNLDPEYRAAELKRVEELLFGDETAVGDALTHGYGVTVGDVMKEQETTSAEQKRNSDG